jgi:hypothetical protein
MSSFGWPKLSVSLPRRVVVQLPWGTCQRCGLKGELFEDLGVWREHDDADKPTPVAVVLCQKCSDLVIEEHPRLYSSQLPHAPIPGVMELCRECTHRHGYLCGHADLTVNGGPGLEIVHPTPTPMHVNRGRGKSGWMKLWNGPATSCVGRSVQSAGGQDGDRDEGGAGGHDE